MEYVETIFTVTIDDENDLIPGSPAGTITINIEDGETEIKLHFDKAEALQLGEAIIRAANKLEY